MWILLPSVKRGMAFGGWGGARGVYNTHTNVYNTHTNGGCRHMWMRREVLAELEACVAGPAARALRAVLRSVPTERVACVGHGTHPVTSRRYERACSL